MNHYAALQLKTDDGTGLWQYTCQSGKSTYPVGFCSRWITCPECKGESAICEKCKNKGFISSDNPCQGHKTKEEAQEHYREYLISLIEIKGPKTEEWPKNKCDVENCNVEGTYFGYVPGHSQHYKYLCEAHATKEEMAKLIGPVGETWSSY